MLNSIKYFIYKMIESRTNIPLIDIKGDNLNLIQINFDSSENSTRESNHSGEYFKSFEDIIDIKNDQNNMEKKDINKFYNKRNSILNKKIRRDKNKFNFLKKNNNKQKNGKYKIILNLFNEFKSNYELYEEFYQFHFIEKNIKNNLYSSPYELAIEIRNIFSHIFSKSYNYDKTLFYCELFEKIYKKYDNKPLKKKCKNLVEIINKLKRELHKTEIERNINFEKYENKNYINNNNLFYLKNKFKLEIKDNNNKDISEMSVKKYKNKITNKIKNLNIEQKRGILRIISNNFIDKNIQNNVMEININKMNYNQLKQLDKYINECIKNNNLNINCSKSNNIFIKEENECDIIKNDDLSSCLSDDEDEDDE